MKRPLCLFCISLIIGIIFSSIFHSYMAIFSSSIFITGVLIIYLQISQKKQNIIILVGILVFFTIGAIEYLHFDNLSKAKLDNFFGEPVLINGTICSEPQMKGSKINYILKTQNIKGKEHKENMHIKILVSTLNRGKLNLKYGDKVNMDGILEIAKPQSNPGGFDYRKYLLQNKILALMFVRKSDVVLESRGQGNFLVQSGINIKNNIVQIINQSLPKQQAGLLNGMLIGYTNGLDQEVQDKFNDSGLTHIMAVSGANVAFIIFPLIYILRKIRINRKISNVIAIVVLLVFLFITGFEASVIRAVIMAIVLLVSQILLKEPDTPTSIAFAALIMLIYNPFTLFNVGFQLSFAATISIMLFYKPIKQLYIFKHVPKTVTEVISSTLAAQIGVLPIISYHFNKISLISLVSNIFVIPLTGVITVLGMLMTIMGAININIAKLTGYINCSFLSFVLYISKITAEVKFSTIMVMTPPIILIISYYLFALYFVWYKPIYNHRFKLKTIYGILTIVLILNFFVFAYQSLFRDLKVVFFDVGQGDCTFIRTYSGKTMLIDGGGFSQDKRSDKGKEVAIPYLLDNGIAKLDAVVLTHFHDDHMQGILSLIDNDKAKLLLLPKNTDNPFYKTILRHAKGKNIKIQYCQKGDVITVDDKTILNVLNPSPDSINNKFENNNSLVLRLIYKKVSILFTGDMEEKVENTLVEEGVEIKSDILKVAHHGSNTSSGERFLKFVNPCLSVISVGKNNFGHPDLNTIQRLNKYSKFLLRTDLNGAVTVYSDGYKFKCRDRGQLSN